MNNKVIEGVLLWKKFIRKNLSKEFLKQSTYQEEFEQRVLKAEHPVVVDFYADWCGPCKMLSPVLDELEGEFDDFEFVKVNIDENQELAEQFEVFSIPNVCIFKNGEVADRNVGFASPDAMREFVERNK